jgi:hypothetical protein
MYTETDPRVLGVLARALSSSSRATRLRAVAMLGRVECERRERWLDAALEDRDVAVRQTALIVSAWTTEHTEPVWPEREDPAFDLVPDLDCDASAELERATSMRWGWEYAVEIWRGDGLLVGVFLSTTCGEDDEHAKRIALGQAILASSSKGADQFDPGDAAAFIVGKRRVRRGAGQARGPGPSMTT